MTGKEMDAAKSDMHRMISDGLAPEEVSRRTGMSLARCQRVASAIETRKAGLAARRNPRTDAEIESRDALISQLWAEGKTAKQIHDETGIPMGSVYSRMKAIRAERARSTEAAGKVAQRHDEEIREVRAEIERIDKALVSQSQFLYDLAERVEAVEKRMAVIVPEQMEETIRNLTAERDLYRSGARSQQARADRLDARITNLGLLPDDMHQELKRLKAEREGDEDDDRALNGGDYERERDQDLDGEMQAPADQGAEADRG